MPGWRTCAAARRGGRWAQRLSGGEQQRVALARALLLKPDWLFLDEATASLDPEGEARFYTLLKERLPGTTLVSIAHRPAVAQFHDRRLSNGRLSVQDDAGRRGVGVSLPAASSRRASAVAVLPPKWMTLPVARMVPVFAVIARTRFTFASSVV